MTLVVVFAMAVVMVFLLRAPERRGSARRWHTSASNGYPRATWPIA
jgi:hypothetical protein